MIGLTKFGFTEFATPKRRSSETRMAGRTEAVLHRRKPTKQVPAPHRSIHLGDILLGIHDFMRNSRRFVERSLTTQFRSRANSVGITIIVSLNREITWFSAIKTDPAAGNALTLRRNCCLIAPRIYASRSKKPLSTASEAVADDSNPTSRSAG
jgi:hypothetical protein